MANRTERYDYREAMADDIYYYLCDNGIDGSEYEDRDEALEKLNDALWVEDSVTGNASGSYTMCRATARQYVADNMYLMIESYKEFGCMEQLASHLSNGDYEVIDVTIRCYLLGEVLASVIEELEAEAEQGRSDWGYSNEVEEVEENA